MDSHRVSLLASPCGLWETRYRAALAKRGSHLTSAFAAAAVSM